MSVNYIYKNKIMYANKVVEKIKKKDLKDYLSMHDMFQVAPSMYINLENVREIDYVNHIIFFDNGDKISGIIKKIMI